MSDKAAPDPDFEALLRYLQDSRAMDFRGYKRASLRRRVSLRMEAVGVDSFAAYQAHLEAQPDEFENLLNTVLINVTSFFRDPEAWEVLRTKVIPSIIERARDDRPIRIWSVGCASGAEPYSLAMLFAEQLGLRQFCERVKIYATDLDEGALTTARQAAYLPREVEDVPPELLETYFERTGAHYVFHRDVRKCIIFGRHNVVKDAPISRIDLLICRNLMIYLEGETQEVVLPRLHYALTEDGYLFLGKAETQLARSALFKPVDMKHRIFMKVSQEWRRAPGSRFSAGSHMSPIDVDQGRLMQSVLNEMPGAVMAVDETGTVILASTGARQLLGIIEDDVGRPFQDLPVSYRPTELRAPVEAVLRDKRSVRIENQDFHHPRAGSMRLTIELKPLHRHDGEVFAVLLAFIDTTRLFELQRELATAQENLENSIEELQSANEELETTNEELQSTNEELETTNEELQSTNEELETINEEVRSTSEEMESVNEELRIQADQARIFRIHLESVLRGLNIGVIVVDRRLQVESWNRWNENTWGLPAEEAIGTSLDSLDIGFPMRMLRDKITAVQTGALAIADQVLEGVDRRGRTIVCRIRIFGLAAEDEAPGGAILAFEDVTEDQRKDEYTRYLGRVLGRALNEIYFLDPVTLQFRLTNEGAQQRLGYGAQLAKMTLTDIMPSLDEAALRQLIAPTIAGATPEAIIDTPIRPASGDDYPARVSVRHLGDESPPILLALVQDMSEGRSG